MPKNALYSSPSLPNLSNSMSPSYITPPLTPSSSINTNEHPPDITNDNAARCILISGLPAVTTADEAEAATENLIADAFALTNNSVVRRVDTRLWSTESQLFVVFNDVRHARIAYNAISTAEGPSCRYITLDDLAQKLGYTLQPDFTDGTFYISATTVHSQPWTNGSAEINVQTLKHHLKSFGELHALTFHRDDPEGKTYCVEYCDIVDADVAFKSVANQVAFGMRLTVSERNAEPTSETIYSSRQKGPHAPPYDSHRVPQWENEIKSQPAMSSCATPGVRCDYCPSRGPPVSAPFHILPTPSPPTLMCGPALAPPPPPMMPHHLIMSPPPGPDYAFQPPLYHWPMDMVMNGRAPPGHFSPPPFWVPDDGRPFPALPMYTPQQPIENLILAGHHQRPPPAFQHHYQSPPASPHTQEPAPSARRSSSPGSSLAESFSALNLGSGATNGVQPNGQYSGSSSGGAADNSKNQLNIARIRAGQDTRTTVMIKNIPNKMTDKDLIAYIGKVVPRKIDFLYLRMDFQNGCNVGYAFVNFIDIRNLLTFAEERLGEKWNMFSSEKVLQMSYANYQGKEALVEKFKNSCIMDERESWRPKIFYSTGVNQGLAEPFPAPTHIRRKERSSYNRGALFVPGVHHHQQQQHSARDGGPPLHNRDNSRMVNGHAHEGEGGGSPHGNFYGRRGLRRRGLGADHQVHHHHA